MRKSTYSTNSIGRAFMHHAGGLVDDWSYRPGEARPWRIRLTHGAPAVLELNDREAWIVAVVLAASERTHAYEPQENPCSPPAGSKPQPSPSSP